MLSISTYAKAFSHYSITHAIHGGGGETQIGDGWAEVFYISNLCVRHAVAQLVEALRYKPEGRGFDSRWCHWNFSLT